MNVRSRMVMRTSVERNTAAEDPWGGDGAPGWTSHITDLPCYAWERVSREVLGTLVTVVATLTIIVPNGTDVTNADRLGDVTDRQGRVRFTGPIEMQTVTWHPGYLELLAVKYG